MLVRLILGAGLFAFGYYLGREVGRHEQLGEETRQARQQGDEPEPGDASPRRENPEFQDGETD